MSNTALTEPITDWQQPTTTPYFVTLHYYQAYQLSGGWQYPFFLVFDDGQDHLVSYASKVSVGQSLDEVVAAETRQLFHTDQYLIDFTFMADSAKTRDGQRLPRLAVHVFVPPNLTAQAVDARLTPKWLAHTSKKLRVLDAFQYLTQQTRRVQVEFITRYGLKLTSTLESANLLEEGFAKTAMPPEEEGFWVQAFGSYLTFLLLRLYEGVLIQDPHHDDWTLSLIGRNGELIRTSPLNKVTKRFRNGEEDHLGFYAHSLSALVQPRQTAKIFEA